MTHVKPIQSMVGIQSMETRKKRKEEGISNIWSFYFQTKDIIVSMHSGARLQKSYIIPFVRTIQWFCVSPLSV